MTRQILYPQAQASGAQDPELKSLGKTASCLQLLELGSDPNSKTSFFPARNPITLRLPQFQSRLLASHQPAGPASLCRSLRPGPHSEFSMPSKENFQTSPAAYWRIWSPLRQQILNVRRINKYTYIYIYIYVAL